MARIGSVSVAALALAVVSCTVQGTEIVLTVDTDFEIPTEADALMVRVVAPPAVPGGDDYVWERTWPLGANPGEFVLPGTLSVRNGPESGATVAFHAELLMDGVPLVVGDASADFVEGRRVDARIFLGLAGAVACPGDPVDGTVGTPCTDSLDCGGNFCIPEQVDRFGGEAYVSYSGGYCLARPSVLGSCNPYVAESCPDGGRCVYAGTDASGEARFMCLDACRVADANDRAFRTNCDCREGYECERSLEACIPGCSNDSECCETWDDADADRARDDGEVARVPECDGWCDRATWRCGYAGQPGAAIGSPCDHDSRCPSSSTCLPESGYPGLAGGMCVRVRCDLAGNECDEWSGCSDVAYGDTPYHACLPACRVGTVPGDPGFACRPGYACRPAEFLDAPSALPDATGFCWSGNWSGVTENNVFSSCSSGADCYSPWGLGSCLQAEVGGPAFCTLLGCFDATVASVCEAAGGVCLGEYLPFCLESCTPGVEPVAGGCPQPGFGCYVFRTADGEVPACYFECGTAADCPSGSCNPVSHGCEW